ncbi:MAG: DUF1643 domain-containing protein [Betaproteobacteria bacterium]|nr:MAG: DUF1643 domain-containing protein [Betaproteobacteria bacterium]
MNETSALRSQYSVAGLFYEIPGSRGPYACRSVLEISSNSVEKDAPPDAIFVMMNPGNSVPLAKTSTDKRFAEIVPAKPDTTQDQVMRVMQKLSWHRVRILNLSDLRNSKSKEFYRQVDNFNAEHDNHIHSIFSSQRADELRRALARSSGAPIVVAWGCHYKLKRLASFAIGALAGQRFVGVPASRGEWRYLHPLPPNAKRQREWLESALRTLT